MSGVQGYTAADLARLRSVAVRPRGWSHRVRPVVREHRDERGRPVRVTLDELGARIRERWDGQDVHIVLPHIRVDMWRGITEER
ncbi:hypothetical protein ACFY19_20695 [Streptosporangium saharense]|uniref:hypothetical protein n=1 Tax=Streptosporangium saharense TaxID=1706840 RepID=UPI0036B639A8